MRRFNQCCIFFLITGVLFAQNPGIRDGSSPGGTSPGGSSQGGTSPGGSSPDFRQGEELFLRNRPAEAVGFLEKVNAAEPANIPAALYLAMAYEQLGRADNAIAVYRRILPAGGEYTALIAFNLGNVYYAKGTAAFAEQFYTQAIEADPGYASAYLNRANTRIKTGALAEAVPDYELYLALEPASSKRPQIERLISLVEEEAAAAERHRLAVEAAARAEEERRRQLIDEVSASLQAAAEETQGFTAGSEDVTGYEGEFELE
ncbi:MAG: tetratricopeptide repeat protein [Treponema sp.]|nr:tetratricopeptide repeat protein [Treponema sp.]